MLTTEVLGWEDAIMSRQNPAQLQQTVNKLLQIRTWLLKQHLNEEFCAWLGQQMGTSGEWGVPPLHPLQQPMMPRVRIFVNLCDIIINVINSLLSSHWSTRAKKNNLWQWTEPTSTSSWSSDLHLLFEVDVRRTAEITESLHQHSTSDEANHTTTTQIKKTPRRTLIISRWSNENLTTS